MVGIAGAEKRASVAVVALSLSFSFSFSSSLFCYFSHSTALVSGLSLVHRSDGYPGALLELAFLLTSLIPSHTYPFGVGFPFGITLGSRS